MKQEEGEKARYNHAGKNHDESLQSLSMRGALNACQAKTGSKPSDEQKHPELGLPGCGKAYTKTEQLASHPQENH